MEHEKWERNSEHPFHGNAQWEFHRQREDLLGQPESRPHGRDDSARLVQQWDV